MISFKKISVLALLCLTSTSAWSETVYFCKVKKIYDASIRIPTEIVHEECSGVAFLWYAKDLVKASCWEGATDLLEGKCDKFKEADSAQAASDVPENEEQR
jgi:hypothetical protein